MTTQAVQTRILSIDGGGAWALIPALALAEIYGENTRGHDILRDFDYVAANSGGSLVVAGLIENRTPAEICEIFLDPAQRKRIFRRVPWYRRLPKKIPLPRYCARSKGLALSELFRQQGQQPLSSLRIPAHSPDQWVRFVFMSYNYRRDRAGFLRSYDSLAASSSTSASSLTLAEAVHASTNAPILYFDRPASIGSHLYWDGGLSGYNNPILAATIEAVANGAVRQSVVALSLGTALVSLPLPGGLPAAHPSLLKKLARPGIAANLHKAATTVLADPPDAHSFIAHLLLGGAIPSHGQSECSTGTAGRNNCPIVRLNPLIQPWLFDHHHWQVPAGLSPRQFRQLVELDMDATEQKEVDLIQRLFKTWQAGHVRNQAIRADGPDPQGQHPQAPCTDIGHTTFAEGVAAWRALAPPASPASSVLAPPAALTIYP